MAIPTYKEYVAGGGKAFVPQSNYVDNGVPTYKSYTNTPEYKKWQTVTPIINRLNTIDRLKTAQEKYNLLHEARKYNLIDKKKQLELIKAITNNEQVKIQKAGQPQNPLEHVQSFFGGIGGAVHDISTNPGAAVAGANERFLGGTGKALINAVNLASSGLNAKEAERRTNEFLRTTGQTNKRGNAPLTQGLDRNSAAFKTGQTIGGVQSFGLDLGTSLIPGIALSKVLSKVPAIANLIKAGGISKFGGTIASQLPGDVLSTGIMSGQDVARGRDTNLGLNLGIAAGANVAFPLAGALLKGGKKMSGEVIGDKLAPIINRAGDTKLGSAIGRVKDKVASQVMDKNQYIYKALKGVKDKDGRKASEVVRQMTTDVKQAAGTAKVSRENNQAFQDLGELMRTGKKTNGAKFMRETGDAISAKQDAINRIKLGEKNVTIPKLTKEQEQAYSLLNKSTKSEVQAAFDGKLITEQEYKKFMADDNFTHVQREMDDLASVRMGGGADASVSSTTLGKHLKGSDKLAHDPFAAYVDWSNKIHKEIARNTKATYVIDKLSQLEQGKFGSGGFLNKTTVDEMADVEKKFQTKLTGKPTIARLNKGVKEVFQTDPALANSIKNMDTTRLNGVARFVLLGPGMVLQRGATALNIGFAVPNLIKDQVSSLILSKHAFSTHNPIAFWQGIKEGALKPTVNAAARGIKLAGKNEQVWKPNKLFQKWIKENANINTVDLTRNAKSVARQAAEEMGLKGENLVRKAENVVSATEKMTRYQNFFGEYKRALRVGKTTDEAYKLAKQAGRENSIDFLQGGELAEFGKIFNPYLNAGVQGSRSLARALKERPVGTATKIAATVLAPVAGSTYYNLVDPQRAMIYTQIPDYEKEGNLIFVRADGTYLKFPLPIGMKEFASPLRSIITAEYVGDKMGFLETANSLLVKPFNPFGSGDYIPVVAKPIVEGMANYSFFKKEPIVQGKMAELPANEQVYDSTSQTYRDIGKIFGISPLKVQNTIRGYGAGVSEQVVSTVDTARKLAGFDVKSSERGPIKQIEGRFFGDKPSEKSNAVVDKFYKSYVPLKAQKTSVSSKVTSLIQDDKLSEARSMASDFNKIVDSANSKYKTTYGKYTDNTELLKTLNKLKINLTPRSISSRKKQ